METIDTIILAGGRGTRLQGMIQDLPKPLAPVNGRPFLDIILNQLNGVQAIQRVVIAAGYKSEKIIEHYKECPAYRFSILFSEEQELLGTGGAIKKALALTNSDCVLIMNGDSYVDADIDGLFRCHRENSARISIVLKEMDNASRYGCVTVDSRNRILGFEEKRPQETRGLINAGIYLIDRSLFDRVAQNRMISFEKELLPDMIRDSAYGFIAAGKFIDIGVPEEYKKADSFFQEEL
jgi:D-glycero-alpha-D-manno-heptose 1-phosphate guanylyltransferase